MRDILLGVNIDHIATLRNARGTSYPDPVHAADIAERAGADGITVHLREDRRHIMDRDVALLRQTINTRLNLEMAVTDEMVEIALKTQPEFCCLVPEKREELTTEGGLDVVGNQHKIADACKQLGDAGILVSLFIDADFAQIDAAVACNAPYIEIHTGQYWGAEERKWMKATLVEGVPDNILGTTLHILPKVQTLLETIKHETEDLLPYHNEFIACCMSQLIICFIRWKNNAIPHKFPESATQLNYRSEIVKRAMTFIEQEYQKPLSLKQLSLAVACSESYLRALIKKETGSNFSSILQKQRILAAKHFLRESAHSLEEIAFAVGYNSLPFFFKVFKRWTGMTPMEYSRSLGEPSDNARK